MLIRENTVTFPKITKSKLLCLMSSYALYFDDDDNMTWTCFITCFMTLTHQLNTIYLSYSLKWSSKTVHTSKQLGFSKLHALSAAGINNRVWNN